MLYFHHNFVLPFAFDSFFKPHSDYGSFWREACCKICLTSGSIQVADNHPYQCSNQVFDYETISTKRSYRVRTVVNTNMHLEAFHRLLKVVYLGGKQNRRVDYLLSIIFKIAPE